MDYEILVSVICLTYNHEKYIKNALESFIAQKTNFKFEVIVHDDASTDNTPKIIRDYENNYPEIIKPIYQFANQHSQGTSIIRKYILPKIRGKYVAICEGDDFWLSNHKLQLQVNALEKYTDCLMCSHKTEAIDLQNNHKWYLPLCELATGVIDTNKVMDAVFGLMHLSSDMFRTDIYKDYYLSEYQYKKMMPTGDKSILLYFANKGPIYFINEVMSRYNKGVIGSYTSRIERNQNNNIEKNRKLFEAEVIFRNELCKDVYKPYLDYHIAGDWLEYKISKEGYRFKISKEEMKYYKLVSKKRRVLIRVGRFFPGIADFIIRVKYYGK